MNTAEAQIRELDFRESAGLQVTLLWRALGNRVWVQVRDLRIDEAFTFGVAPAEASNAFHHPFAYAPPEYGLDGGDLAASQSANTPIERSY